MINRMDKEREIEKHIKGKRNFERGYTGRRRHYDSSADKEIERIRSQMFAIISMIGLTAGILFLSPSITGNAIGNLNLGSENIIGEVLIIIGLIGAFVYFRKIKQWFVNIYFLGTKSANKLSHL